MMTNKVLKKGNHIKVAIVLKTIGLLGGMSWESTEIYYRELNRMVRMQLGGLHSAKIILDSYDFAEIVAYQQAGDWDGALRMLIDSAQALEKSGADMILICTNTMHILAESLQNAINIPLIHIADAIAEEALNQGIETLALLGTQYTMEQTFYKEQLAKWGIRTLVPSEEERKQVHQVIFDELCQGIIREDSRDRYQDIIENLILQGAEAVILGCTEIPLLIQSEHASVPLLDSTRLHAKKAIDLALSRE